MDHNERKLAEGWFDKAEISWMLQSASQFKNSLFCKHEATQEYIELSVK